MTLGVGLFGTITAFLANIFVSPGEDEPDEATGPLVEPAMMMAQMVKIENMLLAIDRTSTDLKAKVENLEILLENHE